MDGAAMMAPSVAAGAAGGGGTGGPAPFLLKTYDMVEDTTKDDVVSWTPNGQSFVVWNPPEFARLLLPTYFKHNNFSSFIRQLNTYGFRKIDPERWEFANEDFIKDQKHLLRNIHRRKPIHSHSHPPGSAVDPERAAFEEEIDKLSREKMNLEANVQRSRQQQSTTKLQLEELNQRVGSIEHRQETLLMFLEKAVQNPDFVERLSQKLESMEFVNYNKKRRVPQVDNSRSVQETVSADNSSSRSELGNINNQDFSSKLRLELSPAVSDMNLFSHSTQSSNEDAMSPRRRISEGWPNNARLQDEAVLCPSETLELSDTGASFALKMDSSLSCKAGSSESPSLHLLQQSLPPHEDSDNHISCHLNLTLAYSPLQTNNRDYSTSTPIGGQEVGKSSPSKLNENCDQADLQFPPRRINLSDDDANLSSSRDAKTDKHGPATAPVRVNDLFWEQFLTERPGCSDNEEASSCFRADPYDDLDEKKPELLHSRSSEGMEQLSL